MCNRRNFQFSMGMETPMAGADDLDDLHREILDVLAEGRGTPSYLAERTGESRQLVSQKLRDLRMAGFVERVHTGLYELVEDPRK